MKIGKSKKGKTFCRHKWVWTGEGCTYIEYGTGLMRVNKELVCEKCGKIKMSNDVPGYR